MRYRTVGRTGGAARRDGPHMLDHPHSQLAAATLGHLNAERLLGHQAG